MRTNRSEHVANVALRANAGVSMGRTQTHRAASPFNLYNALRVSCVIVCATLVHAFFF